MNDRRTYGYQLPVAAGIMTDPAGVFGVVRHLMEHIQRDIESARGGQRYRTEQIRMRIQSYHDYYPEGDPRHIQNMMIAEIRIDVTPEF